MAIATQDSVTGVEHGYVRAAPVEAMPAPGATTGVVGWMRANLLSGPANIVLTIFSALLIFWLVPPIIEFMFTHAVWSGADREACLPSAADPDPAPAGRSCATASRISSTAPTRSPSAGASTSSS